MEQAAKSFLRRKDIEQAFYRAVSDVNAQRAEPARFPLSPSAATKPMRDLYYDLLNYYTPGSVPVDVLEPKVQLIFQLGHEIEALVKEYFREAYQLKNEQHRVVIHDLEPGVTIGGNIDWAVKIDGETILMDCKTANLGTFCKAPKDDNVAQMQLYMHSAWGRANNVNRAILVYFHKDTSDVKCIEVNYNKAEAERLLGRLIAVWCYYKSGQVPPREFVLGYDWQARYSKYRTIEAVPFSMPVDKRTNVGANFAHLSAREHVLKFDNAAVNYTDGIWYPRLNKDKIELVKLGDDAQWEETA